MAIPDETITDAEDADATKIFKGAMCDSPKQDALDKLELGCAYFGWPTPYPFTSDNYAYIRNGGFFNLYDRDPALGQITLQELQGYRGSPHSRKLFLIGTNERDLSIRNDENWNTNANLAAPPEAALWQRQIDLIYKAYEPTIPLIYAAGGSQNHAHNNPGGVLTNGQNLENYPVWIGKVWNNLDAVSKSRITGFHIHYYPGADRYPTDPIAQPHRNPYPQWSRESIGYRIRDWYNWLSQSSDRAGKKIILSERAPASGEFLLASTCRCESIAPVVTKTSSVGSGMDMCSARPARDHTMNHSPSCKMVITS